MEASDTNKIKVEAPEVWELPREVDLLSDDGSQDISSNKPDHVADTERPTSTKSNKRSENLGSADLLAIQRKLAEKYRTNKPKKSPEPEPEPELESDDDEAKDAAFEQAKKIYNRRLKSNKIDIPDEIAFMQLEADFMARKRKREADEEFDRTTSPLEDDDEGLFVPDDNGPRFPDADSDDESPRPRKRSKANGFDIEKPKKGRGQRARKVVGQDYSEQDFESIIRNARSQNTAKSKQKAPTKSKPTPAPKAKSKQSKARGTQITNLGNLFGGDVFKDTAGNTASRFQPTFQNVTRKDDAMKELIASVPKESVHVSRADKKHLNNAIKNFTGHGSVSAAEDGNWAVKGMKTTLKHFQVLGAGFMRARETQDAEPRGGILADEMGLGKTIMMLANIVNGRPATKTKNRATLVVASPALISQWFHEIRQHTYSSREHKHGVGKVIKHFAGNRIKSNDDAAFLEEADIVLTTYHEVSKSYPKAIIPPEKVCAISKEKWWREFYDKEKGPIHTVSWHRVVLDESQAIKNRNSHTSLACRALQAKHRWCMTGTPLLNSIAEMYPYLAFIREPNVGSYKIYKENFCSPNDPDGKDKLGVLLRRILIRRTHLDRMFDAKLVDLPPPCETTVWLELNDVERAIYEIVKTRFIEHINSISKKGKLKGSYSHIWVLILRLRQLCAHTLMIGQTCLDLLERSDYEKLNELTQSEDKVADEGAALLVHLRQVLRDSVDVKEVDVTSSVMQQNEGESFPTGLVDVYGDEENIGNAFGLNYIFRKYLDDYKHSEHWEAMVERTTCCGCRQKPSNPYLTSCLHIYCHSCLLETSHYAARRGYDQVRCSECGTAYTSTERLEDTTGKPLSSSESDEGTGRKGKKKDPTMNWIEAPGPVLPSAKSVAVKAAILNFVEEDPHQKIIIYTQWNPMVRILEKVCRSEGWQCRKYTGNMSVESKDRAVHEFSNLKDVNILIAGLKCGGLGLNLTAAQRVLLIDPWWNKAIEQQAFCRVFRIGQQKTTSLTRFVCRNTIDEAMMQVKERKQIEIDELMNNSKLREKLTVEDLMRLFGKVEEDEEGRPFIFADARSDDGIPRADGDDDNEFGFMNTDE